MSPINQSLVRVQSSQWPASMPKRLARTTLPCRTRSVASEAQQARRSSSARWWTSGKSHDRTMRGQRTLEPYTDNAAHSPPGSDCSAMRRPGIIHQSQRSTTGRSRSTPAVVRWIQMPLQEQWSLRLLCCLLRGFLRSGFWSSLFHGLL